jgi:hypothetical protein
MRRRYLPGVLDPEVALSTKFTVSLVPHAVRAHLPLSEGEVKRIAESLLGLCGGLDWDEQEGLVCRHRVADYEVLYEVISAKRTLKVVSVKPYLPN